jgi:hypothetical protein
MLEFRHGAIGSNGSQRFFSNRQPGESSRIFKQLLADDARRAGNVAAVKCPRLTAAGKMARHPQNEVDRPGRTLGPFIREIVAILSHIRRSLDFMRPSYATSP